MNTTNSTHWRLMAALVLAAILAACAQVPRQPLHGGPFAAIVEPGGVKTEMSRVGLAALSSLNEEMTPEQNARYGALMQAIPSHVAAFTKAGVTSDVAAKRIAKAVTDGRPRTRYTIGATAAFLIRASRILPDRLLDRMTTSDLRKHYPAGTRGRTPAARTA
jgi:hypothetical protein